MEHKPLMVEPWLHCPNNTTSSTPAYPPLPDEWELVYTLVPPYILTISALGLLFNSFVLAVFIAARDRLTVAEIYLSNLALADFFLMCCLPFWATNILAEFNWPHGEALCKIVNSVAVVNLYVSIFTLVMISLDRHQVAADLGLPPARLPRAARPGSPAGSGCAGGPLRRAVRHKPGRIGAPRRAVWHSPVRVGLPEGCLAQPGRSGALRRAVWHSPVRVGPPEGCGTARSEWGPPEGCLAQPSQSGAFRRAVWHSPVRVGPFRRACVAQPGQSGPTGGCVAQPGQSGPYRRAVWHSPSGGPLPEGCVAQPGRVGPSRGLCGTARQSGPYQRAVWHSPVRVGPTRGLCGTARSEWALPEGCVAQPVRVGPTRGLCGTARSEWALPEGCVAQPVRVGLQRAVWHSPSRGPRGVAQPEGPEAWQGQGQGCGRMGRSCVAGKS
ncbi:hypothetical protein WMY93_032180 [Mugilogobius chulae]|uniref:G-protein coupled receptors family 1 profile domain-containing protein n=1 Tax=Mugilogobius chulae TaxID=88201 RepID=A0AAW0MD45_9GOBI